MPLPPASFGQGASPSVSSRSCRSRELLENGTHATIAEIANSGKINEAYVGRILRLTLLAPTIVEMIIDGEQCVGTTR
jgi:hypothetical protein